MAALDAGAQPARLESIMKTRTGKKLDLNQLAKRIVDEATGAIEKAVDSPKTLAGRAGGKKGGRARAASLTAEQRVEIATVAAQARWKKT